MSASGRLLDWGTAGRVGGRLAGSGPMMAGADRARLREDFAHLTREAEKLVVEFTGLHFAGPGTRAWVMSRREWIVQNLRSFERLLEPLAGRVFHRHAGGPVAGVRRQALAVQLGGLLGYVGRRVLGQYDLFLPPDDRDLLYFVAPNVIGVERRFGFEPGGFRLWLCLHEVTHRVQFDGVPWLRGYVSGLIESYLEAIELDARRLIENLRRAREEARRNEGWRGLGILFLLMTPEQRETFRKMQAVMSLLEGHGNYVMEMLGEGRIPDADRMRRLLRERRHGRGPNRAVQKVIGLDVKISQYDLGERFILRVVERAGREGFARVWERAENLPTLDEIRRPEAWVDRVAPAG